MNPILRQKALTHFERARQRADREAFLGRLTGKDTRLLPFEGIRANLRQQSPMYRGIQEVPICQVIGSVGRYKEFTRSYLPLSDSLRERWVGVESLALTRGWPPIELYQVGNAYFIKDGNHRAAVARQLEMETIEAHVWQFPSDVEIGPNDTVESVLIRLGEERFMVDTGLNEMFPDHGIRFTTPGRHTDLLAQIEELRGKLSQIDEEDIPYPKAVALWYELIYLPTVQIIRDSTLLDDFPGRTEADLFVWMVTHQEQLSEAYGEFNNLADLAAKLAERYREGSLGKMSRRLRGLFGYETLPPLEGLTEPEEIGD
ncbi:MAG: hypothetical protein KJ063_17330 [Anaerolineae bacterium]|nr:hypothetical protein [Anaerolineae bacterium]